MQQPPGRQGRQWQHGRCVVLERRALDDVLEYIVIATIVDVHALLSIGGLRRVAVLTPGSRVQSRGCRDTIRYDNEYLTCA